MHAAPARRPRKRLDEGAQRLRRVRPLRPAEMRHHNGLAAPFDNRVDCRREPFDAGRVGHPAVPDRDVEIGAHKDALAGDIKVIEGAEARHRRGSFSDQFSASGEAFYRSGPPHCKPAVWPYLRTAMANTLEKLAFEATQAARIGWYFGHKALVARLTKPTPAPHLR